MDFDKYGIEVCSTALEGYSRVYDPFDYNTFEDWTRQMEMDGIRIVRDEGRNDRSAVGVIADLVLGMPGVPIGAYTSCMWFRKHKTRSEKVYDLLPSFWAAMDAARSLESLYGFRRELWLGQISLLFGSRTVDVGDDAEDIVEAVTAWLGKEAVR